MERKDQLTEQLSGLQLSLRILCRLYDSILAIQDSIADSIWANAPWFSIRCSERDWRAFFKALVSGLALFQAFIRLYQLYTDSIWTIALWFSILSSERDKHTSTLPCFYSTLCTLHVLAIMFFIVF